MPSLSEQVQSNIRAITGTAGQYLEDWHALFTLAGIPVGQFNERLIAYYNSFNTGPATESSALNYFLLNPTVVTNGTIPALFASGEQGGWWDPSDFSTMYQDSAGTTPVTATTQPVGMILDKRLGLARGAEMTAASYATQATFDNVTTVVSATAFTQTAGTTQGRTFLNITTVVGQWYEATCVVDISPTGGCAMVARDGAGGVGTILAQASAIAGTSKALRLVWQATTTAESIGWFTGNAAVAMNVSAITIHSLAGNHRTQSTAASRPTLQQDGSGYWYLSYDGVDDFMVTPSVDFTGTSKMTIWAGVYKGADAALAGFFEMGSGGVGPAIFAPNAAATAVYQFRTFGSVAAADLIASGYAAPIANVLSVALDNTQATATLQVAPRINGAIPGSLTPSGGTTSAAFGNLALTFGRRGAGTNPFTGREYGTIIRGAASSASQISQAERYIGSKMGISL